MTKTLRPGMLARFIDTYLAPSDRLAETLCGLIMVLSFTLVAAPQVKEGPEGIRTLLLATIGCNLAWGVIDGVLYVLCAVTQRAQRWRVVGKVKAAGDEAAEVEALRAELDEEMPEDAPAEARTEFYRGLARLVSGVKVKPVGVTTDDILGGLAILLVEVLCTLPAAVPFLLIRDHWAALRTSNALLLLLLFIAGYRWGASTTGRPWRAGLVMLLFGAALVGVALALGG